MKLGDAVHVDWAGRTWDGLVLAAGGDPSYVIVDVAFNGANPTPMRLHVDRVSCP